jgi:hypothetical protein
MLRRLDFGDPVDELPALRIDVVADRIDHHLAMREPAGPNHARPRKKRRPRRHAAPHVDAGIARLVFVRMQLPAHDRVQAIAANDDVGTLRRKLRARPRIDEVDGHAITILAKTDALPSLADSIRVETVQARVEQDIVEVAAVNGELRRGIACQPAQRFAVDELTEAIIENRLPGHDGQPRQIAFESQFAQHLARVRQDIDACAQWRELRSRLEHAGPNARAMQRQRERQPPYPGTDDDDFHASPPCRCGAPCADRNCRMHRPARARRWAAAILTLSAFPRRRHEG